MERYIDTRPVWPQPNGPAAANGPLGCNGFKFIEQFEVLFIAFGVDGGDVRYVRDYKMCTQFLKGEVDSTRVFQGRRAWLSALAGFDVGDFGVRVGLEAGIHEAVFVVLHF